MANIIECTDLSRRFGEVEAVANVALDVAQGEVFGLVGPDGAGKTTTIRMLCGILDPTKGKIRVLDAEIPSQVNRVISEVGYMSQRFSLYGDLTVDENIRFFADIHDVSKQERLDRAIPLLKASRMEPFRNRLAQDLSGGMKQKLALVCTLVHTPKVLFLDEPTTGVDPISRREFWQILYGLVANGMTLFVSTPYMDEADRCQRLALMSQGKILMCDTPANLRKAMIGVVVDVMSSDPRKARELLLATAGVVSAEAFGTRIHATVAAGTDPAGIEMVLRSAGLEIGAFRQVDPSLEDAMISLLGDRERTA